MCVYVHVHYRDTKYAEDGDAGIAGKETQSKKYRQRASGRAGQ